MKTSTRNLIIVGVMLLMILIAFFVTVDLVPVKEKQVENKETEICDECNEKPSPVSELLSSLAQIEKMKNISSIEVSEVAWLGNEKIRISGQGFSFNDDYKSEDIMRLYTDIVNELDRQEFLVDNPNIVSISQDYREYRVKKGNIVCNVIMSNNEESQKTEARVVCGEY